MVLKKAIMAYSVKLTYNLIASEACFEETSWLDYVSVSAGTAISTFATSMIFSCVVLLFKLGIQYRARKWDNDNRNTIIYIREKNKFFSSFLKEMHVCSTFSIVLYFLFYTIFKLLAVVVFESESYHCVIPDIVCFSQIAVWLLLTSEKEHKEQAYKEFDDMGREMYELIKILWKEPKQYITWLT